MYPYERSLVKRLEGKPFALLGINSDDDRGRLKRVMQKEQLTWRSWWDGGSTSGPIATRWNVNGWPTMYLIDHKGVIRFRDLDDKELDRAIDQLLQEAAVATAATRQDKPETPAEELRRLLREYEGVETAYSQTLRAAKTPAERQEAAGQAPQPAAYGGRFLDLAQENPKEAFAFDALAWVLRHRVYPESARAEAQLIRDHVQDPRLEDVCAAASDKLLRALLENNTHREVRGQACYYLAHHLTSPAGRVRKKQEEKEKQDKEAAALLEQVLEKYADLKHGRGTLADTARYELFELRHLAVGRTVPEITGQDLEGKPLKLSEARGKVVVLFFWDHGLEVCRAAYPQVQALVKRSEGKPLTVLGISRGGAEEDLRQALADGKVSWRFWSDTAEAKGAGPIARQWNIRSWPTIYVLDAKGVIRHKGVRPQDLEETVEALLEEEAAGK